VTGPESLDLALDLMDKQLLDSEGTPCGKVEDIELQPSDKKGEGPAVVAVLTSLGTLGPRLGGRVGRWMVATWRRLRPEEEPQAARIPWEWIEKVDFAIHLSVKREEAGLDLSEGWFRDHVIARIPGAG
jgi:sporulation protein YlmC with PRC-barrel domain